jgi:hypothetical protein
LYILPFWTGKNENISNETKNGTGYPISPLLIKIVIDSVVGTFRQEKEIGYK